MSVEELPHLTVHDMSRLPAPVAANKLAGLVLEVFGESNERLNRVLQVGIATVELLDTGYGALQQLPINPRMAVDMAEA